MPNPVGFSGFLMANLMGFGDLVSFMLLE